MNFKALAAAVGIFVWFCLLMVSFFMPTPAMFAGLMTMTIGIGLAYMTYLVIDEN